MKCFSEQLNNVRELTAWLAVGMVLNRQPRTEAGTSVAVMEL